MGKSCITEARKLMHVLQIKGLRRNEDATKISAGIKVNRQY